MSKISTWFKNGWTDFLNWFGSAEAAVVSEGKTIIDELVPVIKQDLLADGSALVVAATTALATGGNPIAGIAAAAEALIPAAEAQGITLSKEAATTAAAFISAKITAAQTSSASGAGTAPATTAAAS